MGASQIEKYLQSRRNVAFIALNGLFTACFRDCTTLFPAYINVILNLKLLLMSKNEN